MTDVLRVDNLTLQFETIDGVLTVLENVSVSVGPGECVALVGETGCGKSVTSKTVLGVLPSPPARIAGGHILLDGQDLLAMNARERKGMVQNRLAYVPQDPMTSLNPVFTVGQQLMDIIRWRKAKGRLGRFALDNLSSAKRRSIRQEALDLLNSVHMPDADQLLSKYPYELSGGMRQRVLIAMALSGRPALIVADEPTTALDVTVQKSILRLLIERTRMSNVSGLYITHNLGLARELCHRTYVMYAGTVVETDETDALLRNPLHPYTKGLVGAIPKLTGEAYTGIDGQIPDYLERSSGCRFYPRCSRRQEICINDRPTLRSLHRTRSVACHLVSEMGSDNG